MALKKDITDGKGVKTRYHAIRSYKFEDGRLKVTLYNYVNLAMRDAEKTAVDGNATAVEYETETNRLRAELDSLTAQLQSGDESVRDHIVELTDEVNARELDPAKPAFSDVPDTHYGEDEVDIDYFEPVSREGIYERLKAEGKYAGAESI